MKPAVPLAAAGALCASAAFAQPAPQFGAPPGTPKEPVVDNFHGAEVVDEYRWLEEDVRRSRRVAEWVERQNAYTRAYLEQLPGREAIAERLTHLWDYEKLGTPSKRGGRYYIYKNDGLQNQYVLYMTDDLSREPKVLFDPNTWSEDGTVALGGTSFSDDGRYVAYGIQESGSDWRTWRVRDIETGEDLADELKHLKFTGISWGPGDKGFFYSKYPDPKPGEEFLSTNLDMKVMYHRLGAPQAEDVVVFYDPDHPDWSYGAGVTDDDRYLIISASVGTDARHRIWYKDLQDPYAAPVPLITEFENDFSFIGNDGHVFYFFTDDSAPRGRVVAIDTRRPGREHWREIIPERDAPLTGANLVNNLLVLTYLDDVKTRVRLHTLDGRHVRDVQLPGVGTASGFGGERTDTETFYSFQSITTPPSIYRYDMITGESTLIARAEVDFDPDDYVTEQVFFTSRDGTRVPMFVAHRKGISLDGSNPTLLYGYGGFNISLLPYFSPARLAWMEMGGVYAVANLRGGGEYGKEWHDAGKKLNKQNVFDDFIAAAEHLIEAGYTSPEHLAIEGGSNGGLLVGAVMTQRPDLFAAAIPHVGVMDMLRFDEFTAGRFWTDDYGSAKDSPEMFEYLLGYSPYHNIRDGVRYPATMVITADTDDRVVPGHSFKFAARLQEAAAGSNPALIRIETKAGHGSGKPTSKIIEEYADIYAFLAQNTGMNTGARPKPAADTRSAPR